MKIVDVTDSEGFVRRYALRDVDNPNDPEVGIGLPKTCVKVLHNLLIMHNLIVWNDLVQQVGAVTGVMKKLQRECKLHDALVHTTRHTLLKLLKQRR